MRPKAIILMGVSGSGKTTVGRALSQKLGWLFIDGDDFHPQSNLDKMTRGIPLTDEDRWPWLAKLHDLIVESLLAGQSILLACSALKQSYQEKLRGKRDDITIVHLKGDFDLIYRRMRARSGHYFKPEMLKSQFEDLETPTEGVINVPIDQPLSKIIHSIIGQLKLEEPGSGACGGYGHDET